MRRAARAAALALLAACSSAKPAAGPAPAALPKTRAESSGYTETSHYMDVIAFLDSLQKLKVPMYRTVLGTSTEGREIPVVILSRPQVRSAAEAKALHRPIVWVQGNIHSNEVEGKEALQALIRDLATHAGPNVLDSIVLIAVPIYNPDGNEKFAVQAVNRPEQNGPEMIGEGTNGQGLNLNRDYMKQEAPETRAEFALFDSWGADVFMDLHTTDGSFHGYALTYAPSLSPDAFFTAPYTRDSVLPWLRAVMKSRHGYLTYDYGNFSTEYNGDRLTDTIKAGWFTYDARPRFGTNYFGVAGRVTVLAEGYSHDPFDVRVSSMYAFVSEVLSYVGAHGAQITALSRRADSTVTAWGANPASAPPIALRSALARSPVDDTVIAEDLVATGDSSLTQPGVPRGLKRTGHYRAQVMPVWVAFKPVATNTLPYAYAVPAADTAVVRVLRGHGIRIEPLPQRWVTVVQRYLVDSVRHAERPFQGHHETTIHGRWTEALDTLPAGTVLVETAQPLGLVAFYLLEPEADDGLVDWNFFDAWLAPGKPYPVARIPGAIGTLKEPR